MPEDEKEIELKEGESKELIIPLAKGQEMPKVTAKIELGIIGKINQLPKMRNKGKSGDSEQGKEEQGKEEEGKEGEDKKEGENGQGSEEEEGKEGEDKKEGNSRLGKSLGNQGQNKNDKKPKPSLKDKLAEGAGKIGDKTLPKSHIPEKRKRGETLDSDYEPGATKKNSLLANWNRLRASLKKNKNKSDALTRTATGDIANRGVRLVSYELYKQCWLNLISSFGLTYFGLLFLFVAKYVAHSLKFVKFVSPLDATQREKVIKGKEKTHWGWIIVFAFLSVLVLIIIGIATVLIYIILRALSFNLWNLILNPEQFLADLNFFIDLTKDLMSS